MADIAAGDSVSMVVLVVVTTSRSGTWVYNGVRVDPDNVILEENDDANDPDLDCGVSGGDVGEGIDWLPFDEPDNYDCTRHAVGTANLTITKEAAPAEGTAVAPGSTITYTLTASNEATAIGTARDVLIRDDIGTGLDFVEATGGTGVTCTDIDPPEINCTATSIGPGQSRTVSIEVTVDATSGTVVNDAYVDPDDAIAEANEDDNYDSTSHSVGVLPDLTITKTASPASGATVATGDTITYTLTVTNEGTVDATDVNIRDDIGTGLDLEEVTGGTGVTCTDTDPPQINCTATSIPPGESRTVTIEVTVDATSGTVVNDAYVDPDDAIAETNEDANDPDLECDTVGESIDAGDPTEPDNYDCTRHWAAVGKLLNCPLPGKWAMSVWSGPDGTPTDDALATCTDVSVVAAYWLDPVSQLWLRYFAGRGTDVNTLLTLDNLQPILVLGY